ncbi:MAG: hypothetical protein PVF83_13190 [Anaerolineales bacterium]
MNSGVGPGVGGAALGSAVCAVHLVDGGDAVFGIVFVHPDLAAFGAAGHVAVAVPSASSG